MIVKICGITTAVDAAVAVEAGATAIGFNFYTRSPRYIKPEDARDIGKTLPATVLKVGIFVNGDGTEAAAVANLDIAQLYGLGTVPGMRYWRACRMDERFRLDSLSDPNAEAFLLDAPAAGLLGGSGETFDWHRARGAGKRIILAGGLDASNVCEAIRAAAPWGVDACSKLESSPGRKDARKVREFVKAALNL